MRVPTECSQIERMLAESLPGLRPAQRRGLALWVYGTILAGSACQNAVVTALLVLGPWARLRQYLREWLVDGSDKAAPCQTQVDVGACFAPLLGWVVRWWQGTTLALAVDATAHGDRVVALVVSVLYRGCAIPIAWAILPANRPGGWKEPICALLGPLQAAVPRAWTVVVLFDRGLWSPSLWRQVRRCGWHPLHRVQTDLIFRPVGERPRAARTLLDGPGHAWVGAGVAFKHRPVRRPATLVLVWAHGQAAPWLLLTDLAPERVGVSWYALRFWIELGFRALKGVGWQWDHTRRTNPTRVGRHWLVLAVATLWVLAYGTRAEDAERLQVAPGRLQAPPGLPPPAAPRVCSVFRRGLVWLRRQLLRGALWRRLWLAPEPWPAPPPGLVIHYAPPSLTPAQPPQYLPL